MLLQGALETGAASPGPCPHGAYRLRNTKPSRILYHFLIALLSWADASVCCLWNRVYISLSFRRAKPPRKGDISNARSLGRPRSVQGSPAASARAADGQSLEGGSRGDREIVLRRLEVANALRLQSH